MKGIEYKRPDWLPEPTAWDELPIEQKAEMISVGVRNGLHSMDDIRLAYNRSVAGEDVYGDGGVVHPSVIKAEVEGFGRFLASGGKIKHKYDGVSENTQQMNTANIFRRPNGTYFYQAAPEGEEVSVTPIMTTLGDESMWTYQDDSGRRYTPRYNTSEGTIVQGKAPSTWEKVIAASSGNYIDPVLGAPARWKASWENNTNPIKALWENPAITGHPLGMAAKAVEQLAGEEGLKKTQRLYDNWDGSDNSTYYLTRSLVGDALTGLGLIPAAAQEYNAGKKLLQENFLGTFGKPTVPKNYSTISPTVRTKVGDVEINNPELLYHLDGGDGVGAFSNQGAYVQEGMLYPGIPKEASATPYSWWNLGKPYTAKKGGEPLPRLMTATVDDVPSMLHVRSQDYPVGQWNGKRGFVTNSEYVSSKPVNVSNATYTYDPSYGYRRAFQEDIPTAEWAQSGNLHSINNFTLGSEAAEQVPDYKFIGFSLADAKKYKASDGYKALAERAGRESEEMGTGFFPSETFITVNEEIPRITFSSRAAGDKGGYDRANNIIDIDLEQSAGYEVPFHEGLHWQSVGIPSIEIGPNYQRYLDAVANDVPIGIRNTLLKAFRQTPEKERLAYRENAMAYLREKTDAALSEDYPIQGYMRNPEELQANGTETGKALGIEPFAPYPGYEEAKAIVPKAREYNENLKHVKADTPEEVENFWKIITGNYIPAVIGGVLVNEFIEE